MLSFLVLFLVCNTFAAGPPPVPNYIPKYEDFYSNPPTEAPRSIPVMGQPPPPPKNVPPPYEQNGFPKERDPDADYGWFLSDSSPPLQRHPSCSETSNNVGDIFLLAEVSQTAFSCFKFNSYCSDPECLCCQCPYSLPVFDGSHCTAAPPPSPPSQPSLCPPNDFVDVFLLSDYSNEGFACWRFNSYCSDPECLCCQCPWHMPVFGGARCE